MERTSAFVMAVVLVVGTLAWIPAAGLADTAVQAQQTNETMNESAAPGEVLAGVVGVQQAEFDGEVDARTFALRLANATTNESKAAILAAEFGSLENRSEELAERRAELRAAHENGSIGDGRFQAEMAELHARSKTVQRLANQTANASVGLPAETLEAKGINATAIQTLQSEAENLTGPETAAVARSIAGANAGESAVSDTAPGVARNRSRGGAERAEDATDGDRGPPGNRTDAGNESENPGASQGNATGSTPGEGARNASDDRPNGTDRPDRGNGTEPGDAANETQSGDAGGESQSGDAGNGTQSEDGGNESQSGGEESQTPAGGSDDSGETGGSDTGNDSGTGDGSDDARLARATVPLP